jgi:copper chaperone CopZ
MKKQSTILLETLTCPSCLQKINNTVKNLDGVDAQSVNILFNASKVKLAYDASKIEIDGIEKAIQSIGYGVIKSATKTI